MAAAAGTELETVVGLEVHRRLKTLTKAVRVCPTRFGDPFNSKVCPACLGLRGALPVFSDRASELGLRLGRESPERSRFAREHHSYADLPKGYQMLHFEDPLAVGGCGEIELAQEETSDAVADHRAGRARSLGSLVGCVRKATRGRANPGLVRRLLSAELESR